MDKLRITDYFDSVINQIDIFTETEIKEESSMEKPFNERRQIQIEAIKAIEQKNLMRVESLASKIRKGDDESIPCDEALKDYCFVVEFGKILFLATAGRQISNEEQTLLQTLLRWPYSSHREILEQLTDESNIEKTSTLPVGKISNRIRQ